MLKIDLVPTKNLPLSGFIPVKIAGAPSHLTVVPTLPLFVSRWFSKSIINLRAVL